jgi:hypothetical protein
MDFNSIFSNAFSSTSNDMKTTDDKTGCSTHSTNPAFA